MQSIANRIGAVMAKPRTYYVDVEITFHNTPAWAAIAVDAINALHRLGPIGYDFAGKVSANPRGMIFGYSNGVSYAAARQEMLDTFSFLNYIPGVSLEVTATNVE